MIRIRTENSEYYIDDVNNTIMGGESIPAPQKYAQISAVIGESAVIAFDPINKGESGKLIVTSPIIDISVCLNGK